MRIIQRNGIRLSKAKAPTALHRDYATDRIERRPRIWAARNRGCGPSESGIPPEISIVILYLIVPRHPILRRIFFLIFPKSEPGQLQKNYATAWKITKDIYLCFRTRT